MTYVLSFNVLFVLQPTSSVVVRRGFAPVRKLGNDWGASEIVISNDWPFSFPNIQIKSFFENIIFTDFSLGQRKLAKLTNDWGVL